VIRILEGDCLAVLRTLEAESVQCCVTSPPYWGLRDYGVAGQIGKERTPAEYVDNLVAVFREVRRVLRKDGVLWLNIADTYTAGGNGGGGSWGKRRDAKEWAGIASRTGFRAPPAGYKRKELLCLPWLLARAMSADGWYLRRSVIWSKQVANEPPRDDRPSSSHEYVFLFSRAARYSYTRAPGTELSVWQIPTLGFDGAHYATMPADLARRCIESGSHRNDTVLDPFGGAGTTGLVADRLGRDAILIELNPEYAQLARDRIKDDSPLFTEVA